MQQTTIPQVTVKRPLVKIVHPPKTKTFTNASESKPIVQPQFSNQVKNVPSNDITSQTVEKPFTTAVSIPTKPPTTVVKSVVEEGQQNTPSTPTVTTVTTVKPILKKPATPIINSAVVSRRVASVPRLPDWQYKLATTFLMTSDMSSTLDDVDMSDASNASPSTAETDQITEDTTRCICNSTHESEVMIQCDCCKKWLHEDCIKLQNSKESDPFICIFCQEEMSKAVKEYVRKKLAMFMPIVQKCQNDMQYMRQTQNFWNEIMEIVKDALEVLDMIPMFLPTSDRENDQTDLYKLTK